jgi:hypothetical protein
MAGKPPFDPAPWSMLLLAVMIVVPLLAALEAGTKCVWWWQESCTTSGWADKILAWLESTIPVLVALIMWRGNNRPPPPPSGE